MLPLTRVFRIEQQYRRIVARKVARGKLEERDLGALPLVLFAGEVFPTKHLRALMQKLPHPRYANLYGPRETNVFAFYEVEPLSPEQSAPIPIGKACGITALVAIDAEGRKVTEPGKERLLYARGSIVMQGYYGRHDRQQLQRETVARGT